MLGKANIKTKLMNQLKVYWTMKDGQKISVDDMDEQHVRNSLKMVLRKLAKAKAELKRLLEEDDFLKGDKNEDK